LAYTSRAVDTKPCVADCFLLLEPFFFDSRSRPEIWWLVATTSNGIVHALLMILYTVITGDVSIKFPVRAVIEIDINSPGYCSGDESFGDCQRSGPAFSFGHPVLGV